MEPTHSSNSMHVRGARRLNGRYDITAPLVLLFTLLAAASSAYSAEIVEPKLPDIWVAQKNADARAAANARVVATPEWGVNKSYAIPAAEILGFQVLLNQFDRHHYGCCEFHSNLQTIRSNLHGPWVVDSDGFTVNQIGHPYAGSMYYGFARSSGLSFYESVGYAFAGSFLWEIAGERTQPSKNDQIMTSFGGSLIGEPLFRMANLMLENSEGAPKVWREAAAAVISPPTAFNRFAFGDRFSAVFDSHKPVYYSRLQTGFSSTTQNTQGPSSKVERNEGLLDFSIDYGLPGKNGYTYNRPFDYFSFQMIGASGSSVESLNSRGLIFGTDYESGPSYRGIWGLYGSYDYLAPQLFRVASTALSLGTTAQWNATSSMIVQGTATLGVGYTAVGTINDAANSNNNHYGVSPQALLALRFIFSDKVSLDLTGREFFVSRLGAGTTDGRDNIVRGDASLTFRVHKQHAVALKYLVTRRDNTTLTFGDRTQTRGTIGIYYTLLGHDRFGAVNFND
ncbi:MAG: DUF3943 domain-containing protein [Burkholderiales bacterium]